MVALWLGLGAFTAHTAGSIPGSGTKIPYVAVQPKQNKTKKQKEIPERRSQFDNLKKLIRRPPEARLKDVGSTHTDS